jgi:hypothetical protein
MHNASFSASSYRRSASRARAVPLGATDVRGQHAVGHHWLGRGHQWMRVGPLVLPHPPSTADVASLHRKWRARCPLLQNPIKGLAQEFDKREGPKCTTIDLYEVSMKTYLQEIS